MIDYATAYGYLQGSIESIAEALRKAGHHQFADDLIAAIKESELFDIDDYLMVKGND